MGYLHVEINKAQTSKRPLDPCGDVVASYRSAGAVTVILADGLGSGINAHIAATLCSSRFIELVKSGLSIRKAFSGMVHTMNEARGKHMSYTAFTVVHILNDGITTILTYETPAPILLNNRSASVLSLRMSTQDKALIGEAECYLEVDEGLLIVSDGVTQSGLGAGFPEGWTIQGVRRFAADVISQTRNFHELDRRVHQQARENWGRAHGDDISAVLLSCRWGKVVNIMTGPPSSPKKDAKFVHDFLKTTDCKIICGATTAKVVARYLGQPLQVEQDLSSMIAPPSYFIEGIDLVTEGTVTLNQVYNILDEDPRNYEETSGVTELCDHLRYADRINIFMGLAANPASESISFRQKGVLSRHNIVPLLVEKLRCQNKLVVLKYI